jgi:hypothetical protein
MDPPTEYVDQQGSHNEDHVPTDDDDGDPGGQHAELGQGDERRREEQFVGHGIEEGAQPTLAPPPARHVAIQHVREGGQRKHGQGKARPPVHEQQHEHWNQNDPEDGQPVCQSHESDSVYHCHHRGPAGRGPLGALQDATNATTLLPGLRALEVVGGLSSPPRHVTR